MHIDLLHSHFHGQTDINSTRKVFEKIRINDCSIGQSSFRLSAPVQNLDRGGFTSKRKTENDRVGPSCIILANQYQSSQATVYQKT